MKQREIIITGYAAKEDERAKKRECRFAEDDAGV
jgi:hypothetical protein